MENYNHLRRQNGMIITVPLMRRYLFSIGLDFVSELDEAGPVSERLKRHFSDRERILSSQSHIKVERTGNYWTIVGADRKYHLIRKENQGEDQAKDQMLNVYAGDIKFPGVCGGLGEFFGIDPFWFRLLFVLLLIPGGLPGTLPYIALWIFIPPR